MQKAGFFSRFLAVFIDGLILVPFTGGVFYITGSQWAGFPVQLLYEAILISQWNGQTIGKKIMGIRVTTPSGGKVDIVMALIRSISKILSGLILLLGYLWMLWDEKSQTWHDKIANTVAVKS